MITTRLTINHADLQDAGHRVNIQKASQFLVTDLAKGRQGPTATADTSKSCCWTFCNGQVPPGLSVERRGSPSSLARASPLAYQHVRVTTLTKAVIPAAAPSCWEFTTGQALCWPHEAFPSLNLTATLRGRYNLHTHTHTLFFLDEEIGIQRV